MEGSIGTGEPANKYSFKRKRKVKRHGITFDKRINAVEDLGIDPTGEEAIDEKIESTFDERALVEFPPGEYLITKQEMQPEGLSNWGMRGLGDKKTDVRFVLPEPKPLRWLWIRGSQPADRILLENFTVDEGYDVGSIGFILHTKKSIQIHDLKWAGFSPSDKVGSVTDLSLSIQDSDGTGAIEGFVSKGPADIEEHPHGTITLWVGEAHTGTLYIRDSHFENCPSHAMYASRTSGDVRIENCYFKNNQNTNTRISGDGSYVKDSTYVLDPSDDHEDNVISAEWKMRGIWWESKGFNKSGGFVENCELLVNGPRGGGAIIDIRGDTGGLRISDVRIESNVDDKPILRLEGIYTDVPDPNGASIERVAITGTTNTSEAVKIGEERSQTEVVNSCIELPNTDVGIRVIEAKDCLVEDSTINVSGDPVVSIDTDVTVQNLSQDETCD